ncbi:MAG: twin-arginine translocation signal protein [Gemmataceae bacterium]|nr:twin-arginine translocation signal protein [Gemmataceae bacterium]
MNADSNRRAFLRGGTLAAGALVAGAAQPVQGGDDPPKKDAPAGTEKDYPRNHAGLGGPVGSATDRGKLVPGLRGAGEPPVLVETPDLPDLPWKMVNGAKEFHLHAQPVKRELLPGNFMNHWGYNGTMPGPTIQVTEGDRVRIVVHNDLPEPTELHLHGLELPIAMDGVPHITQDPIKPGGTGVYELTVHQTGTYFYHPHGAMQEAIGMVGLFIIHPKVAYTPAVDQDFALITQEFDIQGASDTPDTTSMAFHWLTFNGRCGPYITPLVVRLGHRVRIRILNFSSMDHHPIHLHGHTFWVTGTEGGRIPESAWIPGNNVLVGVAQVREFEFVANNPGDWMTHCHMFHHMMNHMVSGVGPGSRGLARGVREDPRYKVPAFPQEEGMMAPMSPAEMAKVTKNPRTRGMRPMWPMGVMGLMTVVRVLPPDLYDKVVSGKGEVAPGASVPGSMPAHHMEHMKP